MDGIRSWIEAEGTGHWFFLAFPAVLLCLLIWFKGRRVRFIIPSLIMSIVIINPLFYKYWDELGLYAYWRILWVIPVIPVVAGLVPSISERIEKTWVKSIVAVAGVGAVMVGGTFIYNGAGGSFVEAANASKEPDYVVQIADRLLELDEHPRVIAQDPIGVYLRQYSGQIDTLFGRDLNGYIYSSSYEAIRANRILSNPEADNSEVVQLMLDNDYDYLVYQSDPGQQFELIEDVADYGIYRAIGNPSVIKKRNELGQVIKETLVDQDGCHINNENGYCSVVYEYDNNGYVSRTQRFMADGTGIGGEERMLDNEGRAIECYLLNKTGERFRQLEGYYGYKQSFDQSGRLFSREYIDENENIINRSDGYSKVVWEEEDGVTSVVLYNTDNDLVDVDGINLVSNQYGNWSDWITPKQNTLNYYRPIGVIYLDKKEAGDCYSCQIEIEFKNVSATPGEYFRFFTQGATDGSWEIDSIWNNHLIEFGEPPVNGVYRYSYTSKIDERTACISAFELGFRCDYWASGSFRVRKIKIEKGDKISEWSPGI